MGRKTNPNVLRTGNITHEWDAKWFADNREDFRSNLLQDLKIRKYLQDKFRMASIARVEITRNQRETVLTIHTSRPAVVIGRGGSGIEQIQKDLAKIVGRGRPIRINVQEVQNPDTDAQAVATQIVDQLERRMPYRRIIKQAVQRTMQAGARGVRISLSGRLNGAEIARNEWLSDGSVPLHTFRADISFASRIAYTTYGTIGVKVWINRGELARGEEEEAPGEAVAEQKEAPKKRKRSSLAEKAKESRPKKKSSKK